MESINNLDATIQNAVDAALKNARILKDDTNPDTTTAADEPTDEEKLIHKAVQQYTERKKADPFAGKEI